MSKEYLDNEADVDTNLYIQFGKHGTTTGTTLQKWWDVMRLMRETELNSLAGVKRVAGLELSAWLLVESAEELEEFRRESSKEQLNLNQELNLNPFHLAGLHGTGSYS